MYSKTNQKNTGITYPLINSLNSNTVRTPDNEVGVENKFEVVYNTSFRDTEASNGGFHSIQPANSILNKLPMNIILEIFQHVDQFDLVNLLTLCSSFYPLAIERLYKRVTVVLNADFPTRYKNDHKLFIQENGIKFMDSSLILSVTNLLKLMKILKNNPKLIPRIKFFVFDKCHADLVDTRFDLSTIQTQIIEFFGKNSSELNFLHITFVDFLNGVEKLTKFLLNENIRNRIFKLFVTNVEQFYNPIKPQGLTNLFLMLNEFDLMELEHIDLSKSQFDSFYSLFTLTCSTNNQLGFEVLNKLKLLNEDTKLKLKGLTLFHCHKEDFIDDDHDIFNNFNNSTFRNNEQFLNYVDEMNKKLNFDLLHEKIDLKFLTHLYLKIDCNEHRNNNCHCFPNFFKKLSQFATENDGLPQLKSFELELFPNLEWLRPHQLLESILTPLGTFIKTLSQLTRLTIDFSTPGFKMFDNSMGMSSFILNKLNERLMEAFFLCFFSSNKSRTIMNLKTLQLPDFLTSFIYYKPDFYQSLLHSCRCWGCQLVLEKLKTLFYPLSDDDESDEENDIRDEEMDLQSTYYILIGFILGKLQADREVCIPIKQKTFNYKNYPIYKGQPHTLHNHFHRNYHNCKCEVDNDVHGKSRFNIDNLATTYIVHQLRPIIKYLSSIFYKLDNLMVHGIYYEFDKEKGELFPIFDDDEYPQSLLNEKSEEINIQDVPNLPFGKFGRI